MNKLCTFCIALLVILGGSWDGDEDGDVTDLLFDFMLVKDKATAVDEVEICRRFYLLFNIKFILNTAF